ncbi:hypothetical protein ACFL0X_02930 [Nanoarchaeota archaeon]
MVMIRGLGPNPEVMFKAGKLARKREEFQESFLERGKALDQTISVLVDILGENKLESFGERVVGSSDYIFCHLYNYVADETRNITGRREEEVANLTADLLRFLKNVKTNTAFMLSNRDKRQGLEFVDRLFYKEPTWPSYLC